MRNRCVPIVNRVKSRVLRMTGRTWPQGDQDLPWFDRPAAAREAESRSPDHADLLRHWVEQGYVVIENAIPADAIAAMQQDLDAIWTAGTAVDGLRIDQLKLTADGASGVDHSQLIALDPATREQLRSSEPWRIHGFHTHSPGCKAIFEDSKLREMCSLILGQPAEPRYTINFSYGSEQDLHQDTAVFHLYPRNYLIGAWLACEDVTADCGPLVFYPGSHRLPLFEELTNYPQTNLKTCSAETTKRYDAWLESQAERFERKHFIAKQGDVLLWHGMLIHGGSPITREGATRKSYVCHYFAKGTDRASEIKGPFNW